MSAIDGVDDSGRRTSFLGSLAWEVWNETNNHQFRAPTADAARYSERLKAANTTVKQTDPTAIVVTGGTSPAADNGVDISSRTFLTPMYQNGAMGYFDAVDVYHSGWLRHTGVSPVGRVATSHNTWVSTHGPGLEA